MATTGITRPGTRSSAQNVRADARDWRSAHLVGVCGSGMKALAELLSGRGWTVSGSDNNGHEAVVAALAERGLRIHPGHHSRFLAETTDVLVYSPAVAPENAERQRAARLGIPQLSYSQMLGSLMRDRLGVCIAGTHGKSTTTAMTGCILTAAALAPSVVIGAEVRGTGASGWSGDGAHFVVESCEFKRSFLDLSPRFAAILGIEPDHFDCYQHFDETIAAFAEFAQRVPADGRLLIPVGCQASKAACVAAGAAVETFAVEAIGANAAAGAAPADWLAADLRPTAGGTRFRAYHQGEFFAEIALQVPGLHNVSNAIAALALSFWAGATAGVICEGLGDFPGICRRFEPVGSWRGVALVDDYAHHPTAVAATLATARERFGARRLWCVFQPHQVSRTKSLFGEFATSLVAADQVLLFPVFAAREHVADEPANLARRLSQEVVAAGGHARYVDTLDQALATLDDELQPGDVLITMGAGDIGKVHHALTRRLQRDYAARRTPGPFHLAENRGTGAIFHHSAKPRRTY